MISLGITGGIGGGKSFVCKKFAAYGIPVYDSDYRTKQLYLTNKKLLGSLADILGNEIVEKVGNKMVLNKELMASKIFADKELMQKTREIVYPAVMEDFQEWKSEQERLAKLNNRSIPFVILESAVILENEIVRNQLDCVITVEAPLKLRIERVMKRDGISEESVKRRMKSQLSSAARKRMADMVIISGISDEYLDRQIKRIYTKLSKNCR